MDTTAHIQPSAPSWRLPRWRGAWSLKLALGIAAAVVADRLFASDVEPGATMGVFALAVLAALALCRPHSKMGPIEVAAWSGGLLMAFALIDQPNPLAFMLAWCAGITLGLLRTRAVRSGGAWLRAVAARSFMLWFAPIADLPWLARARRRRHPRSILPLLQQLAVPLALGVTFLILFTAANPLLDKVMSSLDMASLTPDLDPVRVFTWLAAAGLVYGLIRFRHRPRRRHAVTTAAAGYGAPAAHGVLQRSAPARPLARISWLTPISVTWSLIVFNLLFAFQNLSDIAFLWGGAALPDGVTFADYAHRGAYPLILTALLAAGFVLVALRSGTETAADRRVRWLVLAWIGQNAFLVLSAMLRTIDYVEAYSLTLLRLSAMIWMGLVAIGLVLVIVRVALGKNNGWLIDANIIAGLLVLGGCAVADLSRMVADYNVRHCAEVGGTGVRLDFWYLDQLGPSAMPAFAWLQENAPDPFIKQAAGQRFRDLLLRLDYQQSNWRSWTFRGHRQLTAGHERELLVSVRQLPNDEGESYTSASPTLPPEGFQP